MRSLIKFELKKMLTRRVAVVVNIGVLMMLVCIMGLNVIQTKTEGDIGEILSGPAAIEYRREVAEAKAGELTPERVAADIAHYQEIAYEKLDPESLAEMDSMAAWKAAMDVYDNDRMLELNDPYYRTILKPWAVSGQQPYQYASRVTPEMASDFYGALADSLQSQLDDGMGGSWEYSDAERSYWTAKEEGVSEPLVYGWAGGWDNILDCGAFLVLVAFAACVTVTPLFAGEYRDGTDAVLLSARYGRGRLVAAKLLVALLYTTVLFVVGAAIICGMSLVFYGAEGATLPIQNFALGSPYSLTMVQACAMFIGIFYLVTIGMVAFTLALSACLSSTLAIIVTDVAILFVSGMLPTGGFGLLNHIFALFPMGNIQSPFVVFAELFSYPMGPIAIDLIGMAALVYCLLMVVGVPVAWFAWSRHQVA